MIKCFYHNSDLDGKCSAAIVKRKFPEADLCGINYGDKFPWEDIRKDMTVIMVDFALQPFEEMLGLLKECKELIWIDHHKTAIEACKASGAFIPGLQLEGFGACELTWRHFFPNDPFPEGVLLLGRYDVWDHSNRLTLPYQYGMRVGEWDPGAAAWELIFRNSPIVFADIVKAGSTILEYETKQNAIKAEAMCFEAMIDGLHVIAANQGLTNSQFFDSVWSPEKYKAMITFHYRGGKWHFSLYSTRDDVDVSAVAKAYGGGGHKGAAGFQIDANAPGVDGIISPFDVVTPIPF